MKKLLLTIAALGTVFSLSAQDFNKNLTLARSAYSSGKLEESRFAMQQMIQELDMMAGKEVLKVLPARLNTIDANAANDNVTAASGFAGVIIHRDYGSGDQTGSVEIISNSPLIASVNAILAIPFIGRSGGDQKVIRIDGYKALLQKNTDNSTSKVSYDVQIPLNSTLVTMRMENFNGDIEKTAGTLPIAQIAKILQ